MSYPFGGNFWSNWTEPDNRSGPDQDEPGSDGIVDEEFQVLGDSNIDYYPFTERDGWKTEILTPESNATLFGFVYDVDGNPLEAALIRIQCGDLENETYTNRSGYYTITNIPIDEGTWTINFSKPGYLESEIKIPISAITQQDFTLQNNLTKVVVDGRDSSTPFPLPPILVLSMGAGSLIFLFVVFTEVGRFAFFSLLFPLYTRLSRDKLLDNYTRGRIHGLIEGIPGIHYSELMRKLAVGNGNLAYHLKTLEREGIIRAKRVGKMKQFYLTDDATFMELKSPSETTILIETTSITENPTRTSILELVESNPGLSESEISDLLGIPKQTVNYHIRSQEITGAVRVERNNGNTRCFMNTNEINGK